MTAPRLVIPGTTVMTTRRCVQRQYLLRPSEETNALLLYATGLAAKEHGVQLHAVCALSNHLHTTLTDPHGKAPEFSQYANSLVARDMNRRLGRRESFWAPGSYNAVTLVTPEDMLDKIAYVLTNPVSARLVRRASEWPGVWTPPELIGAGPITVRRPEGFFRPDGPLPETVTLEFVPPPGFDSVEEFRRRLSAAIARREEEIAEELAREGLTVLGAQKVLAQSPFASPAVAEPRCRLRPRIACLDPEKRKAAVARLQLFLQAYRAAWLEFARGIRDTVFPYGTYWMRIAYGVRCEAPG